jgi:hypothetical protein
MNVCRGHCVEKLYGHDCVSVQQRGWQGIRNGELLRRAEGEFDLFLTTDESLRYQQNLAGRRIQILQLSTNKLRAIIAAAELIRATITAMNPAEFRVLQIL